MRRSRRSNVRPIRRPARLAALGVGLVGTLTGMASAQPAAPAPGLGPVPWSQRADSGQLDGRFVQSDLGPERNRRWVAAVQGAERIVAELLGIDGMYLRATPERSLLLFSDPADFRRELEGRYGVTAASVAGTTAHTFVFDDTRVLAATLPPATSGPAPAETDLAAMAGDLLAAAAAGSYDEVFQDDVPPALAAALELLAAESILLDDGIHPGFPLPATMVAAQVVVRDQSPDLPAILGTDAATWAELSAEQAADATLAVWSLVQFATTRDGGRALALFRAMGARLNEGDRPATAVDRAASPADWEAILRDWQRWIERSTPDPTGDLVNRLEALAAGLRVLAADGVVPASVDDAASALAARDYIWRAVRRGEPVELAVTGPDTFALDEDPGTGRRPTIKLVRPRRTSGRDAQTMPPGLDVRGTRLGRVRLVWERGEDGPVRRLIVG